LFPNESVRSLLDDYNDYVKTDDEDLDKQISPKILGVVFIMVQVYGGESISILRQYI